MGLGRRCICSHQIMCTVSTRPSRVHGHQKRLAPPLKPRTPPRSTFTSGGACSSPQHSLRLPARTFAEASARQPTTKILQRPATTQSPRAHTHHPNPRACPPSLVHDCVQGHGRARLGLVPPPWLIPPRKSRTSEERSSFVLEAADELDQDIHTRRRRPPRALIYCPHPTAPILPPATRVA